MRRRPNNNDNTYGGCTNTCQLGPHCDDGILNGPEECDLGEDNGSGEFPPASVKCDDGCRYDAKLVFLSSATYKGGELGGVEGADLKCQYLAGQAGFDKDFTKSELPYVRSDGVRIADNWIDLILNGPSEGITMTDGGQSLVGVYVWTGTAPSGKAFDANATCKAWSDSAANDKSRVGLTGVSPDQEAALMQWLVEKQWTNYTSFACDSSYRIYCFEQ